MKNLNAFNDFSELIKNLEFYSVYHMFSPKPYAVFYQKLDLLRFIKNCAFDDDLVQVNGDDNEYNVFDFLEEYQEEFKDELQ